MRALYKRCILLIHWYSRHIIPPPFKKHTQTYIRSIRIKITRIGVFWWQICTKRECTLFVKMKKKKNNFVLLWSIATSFLEINLFWGNCWWKRGEKENKFIIDRVYSNHEKDNIFALGDQGRLLWTDMNKHCRR